MIKDISKKLTMKKTFFITQLEGFFNAISQEYQDLIHQKELENATLEEKMAGLQKDVKNLVEIKNKLTKELTIEKQCVKTMQQEVQGLRQSSDQNYHIKLIEENQNLKARVSELENTAESPQTQALQEQIKRLQQIISKGTSYKDTLQNQQKEALIEEISKSLKK